MKILRYIRKRRRITFSQLVTDLNIDQRRMEIRLQKLLEDELIIQVDDYFRPMKANDKVFIKRKQQILTYMNNEEFTINQLAREMDIVYPTMRRAIFSLEKEKLVEIREKKNTRKTFIVRRKKNVPTRRRITQKSKKTKEICT